MATSGNCSNAKDGQSAKHQCPPQDYYTELFEMCEIDAARILSPGKTTVGRFDITVPVGRADPDDFRRQSASQSELSQAIVRAVRRNSYSLAHCHPKHAL